ncbi:MAG: Uma2 family endonuclease [Polyangiaceae bacterium]|nr:Uma2 family endonuclease [Polyangiaceae bacterium]
MSVAIPAARLSAAEFLAWERLQEARHEFHHGEVFAMAGGSLRHNAVAAALIRDLGVALRGGSYRVLTSDQRIAAPPGDRYAYPDVAVVCGRVELEAGTTDVLLNPSVIVEVLSKATEAYDRGAKWEGYRGLPSVQDYLLVSQGEAHIEHFQRQPDGSWRYAVAEVGGSVRLTSGVLVQLDSVFAGVFELAGE